MDSKILLTLGAILAVAAAQNITDKKVLVLLDSQSIRESHSKYFKSLVDHGFELEYKQADSSGLTLFKYGERVYGHVLIFAPSVEEFGGQIRVESLANFVDDGGNILVAAGQNLGEAVRDLTAEFGFELDEDLTRVVDHFAYDSKLDDGSHTTLAVDFNNLIKAPTIVGTAKNPILFRGLALLPDKENPLILDVLRASSTSYSYHPTRPISLFPAGVGRNIALIGALQARNNARVVVAGSLDFFSNAFFDAGVNGASSDELKTPLKSAKSGNEELALALSLWAFKKSGVLKFGLVEHHLVGEKTSPADYTIKENVEYSIEILTRKGDDWVPFDGQDVDLEFVRIDPFVRTKLVRKTSCGVDFADGKFVANFIVPDVYGVFKFNVDYDRLGYTHMFSTTQISVRPFTHTQYERFIGSAYPYYLSALSMIVGAFLFVVVFNSFKDDEPVAATTQKKKD